MIQRKKLRLNKQIIFFNNFFEKNELLKSKKAMNKVLEIHKGKRKDGSPEATHMFEVAGSVLSLLKGRISDKDLDNIIASGFLHDLVEDYFELYSFNDLKLEYGIEIYEIIKKVTKKTTFSKKSKEDYDEYYKNIEQDFRAVIVKALDRIDNMKSMKNVFTIKRQKEYIQEVNDYILPVLKKTRKENEEIYMIMIELSNKLKEQIENYEWVFDILSKTNLLKNENKKMPEIIKKSKNKILNH